MKAREDTLSTQKVNYSLTQLEYVMAVFKHGHFAKAAAASQITQPTLSMQIQKLENDWGVIIFDRSKKPILVTEVGKRVIQQIQTILFEANKIDGIIKASQSDTVAGHLVVGVIPTIAPYLLPCLLPVIERLFPDLELKIRELQTHQIVESLNTDELDVGILATPLKIANIFEYPLYFEPFSVLCKKHHVLSDHKKVKYSSLRSEDIWLLEEGHCLRHQVLDLCSGKKSKSDKRNFKFESGSLETLKNLINSYGGYTLLPAMSTDSIGDNTQLLQFERPIPAREIGLVYRREHYKSELIECLAEAILKSIPESIRKLRQKDLDVLPIES